jgi:CheY-like chemotaxis protein
MPVMPATLLIEDSPSDMMTAKKLLEAHGVSDIQAFSRADLALLHLQQVMEGRRPVPGLIVLDLEMGMESGFEVLRFLKSHPELRSIRVVVWTQMGEVEQELCRHFGVEVVQKTAARTELRSVLRTATT